MSLAWWLNTAWMCKCLPESRAFHRSTRCVAETQQRVLRDILLANRDTWFGRKHQSGFRGPVRAFRDCVPLSSYEDYRQPIERIAAGEAGVLSREAVTMLEPTGGSSGGEKLIPYTPSLRRQFGRGVATWMGDLLRRRPEVRQGRAYWSISPLVDPGRRSSGGLPIGYDDDAAYLGLLERQALTRLLVVPAAVSRIADVEAFRYYTLLKLLEAEDLSLISVWSPTFLSSLFASLEDWVERLCRDLRCGTLSGAPGLSGDLIRTLAARGRGMPRRANRLAAIFRTSGSLGDKLRETWPHLSLISCWTDAAAAHSRGEVSRLFPHVTIQPKGLLATEGFVSLPLVDCTGPALALRSHFFEFIESSGGGLSPPTAPRTLLAHQLEAGGVYRVVLTTAGGLYRYQLHDEVRIDGFLHDCPLLRFMGKADRTSDLVGEKLHESHVRAVLERAFRSQGVEPRFALVVPVVDRPARYRLYLQLASPADAVDAAELRSHLDSGLADNPHYRYAVSLGQLARAEVCLLDARGTSAWQAFQRVLLSRGQRAGNIKPTALDAWTGWPDVFRTLLADFDAVEEDRRRIRTPSPAPFR